MLLLQYCKTQLLCILILIYVGIIYIKEGNSLNKIAKNAQCNKQFDWAYIIAEIAVIFDGITACTVNMLDVVPRNINLLVHLG